MATGGFACVWLVPAAGQKVAGPLDYALQVDTGAHDEEWWGPKELHMVGPQVLLKGVHEGSLQHPIQQSKYFFPLQLSDYALLISLPMSESVSCGRQFYRRTLWPLISSITFPKDRY